MNKLIKIITLALAAAMSLTCLSAFAQEAPENSENRRERLKPPRAEMTEREKPEEMTEEEKAARLEKTKAKLAERLQAGEISQEEYDKMLEAIETTGKIPKRGMGKGPENPEKMTEEEKAVRLEEMKAKLAERLQAGEISQEEYDKILEAIETTGKIPKRGMGKGPENPEKMTEEEKASRLEEMKAKLAERLQAGEISQEEYDKMLEGIENGRTPKRVIGKGPMHGKRPPEGDMTE